jgi:N-acetylmuramoyl-L-alanine amidase
MTGRLLAAAFLVAAALAGQVRHSTSLEVTAVRYWSFADTTRIAVEITGDAHFRADRAENPDRIFFDFVGARPSIDGHRLYSTDVGDKLLKRIRVAETSPGITRIVLDLEAAAEFSVSRLDSPLRFIIELRPESNPNGDRAQFAADRQAQSPPHETESPRRQPMREPPRRVVVTQATNIADPPAIKPDPPKMQITKIAAKPMPASAPPLAASIPPQPVDTTLSAPVATNAAAASATSSTLPASGPKMIARAARAKDDGERSLTRALGLKVNRVVIDPGHGGADQGTVGKRGLMEKELVLDVAKRLGKLIEERMGSEVIYTRGDDTFIPLQARTDMANQKKADLFLSIHANSSPHPKIGGIEVYYLNFTRSPEALDVAARENASSEKSVFELRDLIQTITLHDKIEESKEFAGKVQTSLQSFESRYNTTAKNRGIKKAPFVVLIGASMPSILAEVGFLSNAREELLLKRAEHRQKLAEALFQGLSRYSQTLSHFQVAQRAGGD